MPPISEDRKGKALTVKNGEEISSVVNARIAGNVALPVGFSSVSTMSQAVVLKESGSKSSLDREFTAKDVQFILRQLTSDVEKIGLALLNYYARTNLVPSTGKEMERGRRKYCYSDLILLCWLFRMKREGLPVNRFRRGLDYLRKKLPKLFKEPTDMVLLTDGRQLFLKHRENDKQQIAEVLTGRKAGQYVWAYAIGSLIEEVDRIIDDQFEKREAA